VVRPFCWIKHKKYPRVALNPWVSLFYERKKKKRIEKAGKTIRKTARPCSAANKYRFLFPCLALIIVARRENAWN
jgi:hypothetical protein